MNVDFLNNLDLLSVGVAIAGTVVLGFTVYFNEKRSITSTTFLLFTLITAAWGLLNYFSYNLKNIDLAFALLRAELAVAVLHSFFILRLFTVFPHKEYDFHKVYSWLFIPITAVISLLALTPFVFKEINQLTSDGYIFSLNPGPAIFVFGFYVITTIILSFLVLLKKIRRSTEDDRKRLITFLVGAIFMFVPILILIFVFPAILGDPTFVPYGGLFIFPFIIFISYAILRQRLFNLKIAGIAFLVFALGVTLFTEIVFTKEIFPILYKSFELLLALLFGVLLIRGVTKEVKQKEQIEKLAGELEIANREQQNLIHFITHQVKGFLAKSRNIFAGLLEEDYGKLTKTSKAVVQEGFQSDTKAVETVQEILRASNFRKGTVEMKKGPVDLRTLVQEHTTKQEETAKNKGLKLITKIPDGEVIVQGDKSLLEHVVHNLIDNAVKYTLQGSVQVSLKEVQGKIRFSVKDTGVGITPEDKKRLFTEGGRGKESTKVNVESTGYGLYIVKNIVEKHAGKVWAESAGSGKGSEFIVELPVS